MNPSSDRGLDEGVVVQVDPAIAEIVPTFLQAIGEEIKKMLCRLEQDEFEPIVFWGHSLDGVGIAYGFGPITEIGRSIEKAATDRNPDEVRMLVGQLSTYIRQVRVV